MLWRDYCQYAFVAHELLCVIITATLINPYVLPHNCNAPPKEVQSQNNWGNSVQINRLRYGNVEINHLNFRLNISALGNFTVISTIVRLCFLSGISECHWVFAISRSEAVCFAYFINRDIRRDANVTNSGVNAYNKGEENDGNC